MFSADIVIILHFVILCISVLNGIGQIIVTSSNACHKRLSLSMLSMSILSHVLNVIILGFTDLRSSLHLIALVCVILSGSLQVEIGRAHV